MIQIGPLYFYDSKEALDIINSDSFELFTSLDLSRLSLKGINAWQHWLPCHFQFGSLVYAAKSKNKLLGLMSISRHDKFFECWKIEHIIVAPHYQRQGIASEFLNFIRAIYSSQGIRAFNCEVNINNEQALSLFAAKGFKNLFMVNYFNPKDSFFDGVETNLKKNIRKARISQVNQIIELYEIALPFKVKEAFGILTNQNDYSFVQKQLEIIHFKNNSLKKIWTYTQDDRIIGCLEANIVNNTVIVEYCLHPGYQDMASDLVSASMPLLISLHTKDRKFLFKVFDYQPQIEEALKFKGITSPTTNCYLVQEHWSKVTKTQSMLSPISIQKKVKPV